MDVDLSRHGGRTPMAWLVALALAGLALGTFANLDGAPSPSATAPGASSTVLPSPGACPAPTLPSLAPSETAAKPTASTTSSPVPATPVATATPLPTPTPTSRPSPRPTPHPTPRPSATSAPTPTLVLPTPTPLPTSTTTPQGPSVLVAHGSRTTNRVALTFDMGGRVGDALQIVQWLVDHDVHASIFMTGAMADSVNTNAGRKVLAIVEAHPDLFTLGNHSHTHRDFRDLSPVEIRDELRRTEAAIAPYCSQPLRPYFRPPNGGYDADVLAAVGAAGYARTVTWDVDTIDWRPIVNDPPGPTAQQIIDKVLGNARGGSIVLMHLGGYETFEALPSIVDGLRSRALILVNLEELL